MDNPAHLRIVSRLSMDFLVTYLGGAVRNSRAGYDIIDLVILMTIGVGNVDHMKGDVALSRRYGSADQPAPEELRRPMSRLAVAQALGLTRETTRRKINKLIEDGALKEAGKGVVVVREDLLDEGHLANARLNVILLRNLVRSLRQHGVEV